MQVAEEEPDLVHDGGAVGAVLVLPDLVEGFVGEGEQQVGGHRGEDEDEPLGEELVEEVASDFVEGVEPEEGVGELGAEDEHDYAEGDF